MNIIQVPAFNKMNLLFSFVQSSSISLVRRVTKRFGMKEVGEDEDWTLFWTDCSVALERCMDMRRYQVRLFIGWVVYSIWVVSMDCYQKVECQSEIRWFLLFLELWRGEHGRDVLLCSNTRTNRTSAVLDFQVAFLLTCDNLILN